MRPAAIAVRHSTDLLHSIDFLKRQRFRGTTFARSSCGLLCGRKAGVMRSNPKPILVVDGDPESRASLSKSLQSAGFSTRELEAGEQVRELVEKERPLAVLLEVRLPGASGYEICRQLRDQFGEGLPIIFVSGEKTDELDRIAGLLMGADDYLTKPVLPDALLCRVRRLTARVQVSPSAELTEREREVLSLLVAGHPRAEIARRLGISHKTAAKHIEHILSKLDVHSEAQAVAIAFREHLVPTENQAASAADGS
jgi:DNA-binding NarL/FixJ family response regulator